MGKTYETYQTSYTNEELSEVIRKMEYATMGIERDLVIVGAIALALGKSDPDIFDDTDRFNDALDSVSQAVCFNISAPTLPKKLMN
ncbi:MAG: hypothetical protein AB7J46_06610 [Candidatus Altimarinota bacterium]